MRRSAIALAIGTALATTAIDALAAQRTFIKSDGLDTNPCSLSAPCRTFATAIAATTSGGEVVVLDSAGYGPVTITRSVSIIAPPGIYAGISVPSGDGIAINGANAIVSIEGLAINGTGGANGISMTQGAQLIVARCSVSNMTNAGISLALDGAKSLVQDTALRDNGGSGVVVNGATIAILNEVRVENNSAHGVSASGGASMSLKDSRVSNNGQLGVAVDASVGFGLPTRVTLEDTIVTGNVADGAKVSSSLNGSVATLDAVRSTFARNGGNGLWALASSPAVTVVTVTDSIVADNTSAGLYATGSATVLASRNTVSRNGTYGMDTLGLAVIHTRSNNAGEQATPTHNNVVPVAGF